jgi:antagonist of KipI
MSLQIIKAGLLDTVQDLGRYGYQHLGINPGGVMDRFSAALANALLGKALASPVIEMHFPAPHILFEKDSILCLAGADFIPQIDNKSVPLNQPFFVKASSVLSFDGHQSGARCYLSMVNEMQLDKWLGSYSTNVKAGAGGWKGRALKKGDNLVYEPLPVPAKNRKAALLPWKYNSSSVQANLVQFIPGPEWPWLTQESRLAFIQTAFTIAPQSDRMGFRLQGPPLAQERNEQLVSSAVSFGTVQLLPDGQLIVLMADHQTTGGYPRIASIVSTHLSSLAQLPSGGEVRFAETDLLSAEKKLVAQQNFLWQLQRTCHQKMQNWIYAN